MKARNSALPDWSGNIKPTCSASAISSCTIRRWPKTVQETYLKAYRSMPAFRGDCSEKTWLMRIAVNVCRDMLRSAWFRHLDRRITLEQLPEPIAQPSEEDCFLTVEVMRLPQKYREAVLLYYYEAMTTDEIAQALGVAKSTVSARLEQGRQALRKALERRRLHG